MVSRMAMAFATATVGIHGSLKEGGTITRLRWRVACGRVLLSLEASLRDSNCRLL